MKRKIQYNKLYRMQKISSKKDVHKNTALSHETRKMSNKMYNVTTKKVEEKEKMSKLEGRQ